MLLQTQKNLKGRHVTFSRNYKEDQVVLRMKHAFKEKFVWELSLTQKNCRFQSTWKHYMLWKMHASGKNVFFEITIFFRNKNWQFVFVAWTRSIGGSSFRKRRMIVSCWSFIISAKLLATQFPSIVHWTCFQKVLIDCSYICATYWVQSNDRKVRIDSSKLVKTPSKLHVPCEVT